MSIYQPTDTLTTDTNVPASGNGSSTPEAAAGNASYATWPWEVMLATVLDIGAPDRGEVTGQPWLTVLTDGQSAGGAHLIWTAGWDTSPNSGAASIQVYLNPALYTTGGAWDRFLNAPQQAMGGVTGGNYAGLPLNPPDFQTVSLSVAAVRNWMATATDHFAALHQQASSGPVARFQGNMADVAAELLGDLRGFMASMHEQMTNPTAYDASIAAAGEAASAFLTDLMSAYSGWTQVPEHSPLGAVVQVLEEIATQDAGGAYVIPDPQNTPYGDLTVSGSWAAVEQQAKTLWGNTLTGGSPDFTGLDPLGRAALSKLVDQFATTSGVIVPVIGPAPPPLAQNAVQPGGGHGGSGGSGNAGAYGPNGGPGGTAGPGGSPGPGHAFFTTGPNGGPNGPAVPGGGPAAAAGPGPGFGPANLAVQPGGPGGQVPAGQVPGGQAAAPPFGAAAPAALLASGPAGLAGLTGSQSATAGNPAASALTGDPSPVGDAATADLGAAGLAAGAVPAAAGLLTPSTGLYGAIGADPNDTSSLGDPALAADLAGGAGGFSGTIGRPEDAKAGAGGRLAGGRKGKRDRKDAALFAGRQAPAPGVSLGSDPGGPVLKQLAVPVIVAKPPAITSSPVNSQLAPASSGASGPAGLSASATSAGPQAQAGPAPAAPEAAPAGMGEPATLAPGAAGASGAPAAGLAGGDPAAGEGGPMMAPPGGMGGRGGGQGNPERQRLAYLPEEAEYWGTAPPIHGISLGARERPDIDEAAEPEFVPVITAALGGGAHTEPRPAGERSTDRRMP